MIIGSLAISASKCNTSKDKRTVPLSYEFSAKDSYRPTDNFFYIAIGNAEPVVTYMENLFGVSE